MTADNTFVPKSEFALKLRLPAIYPGSDKHPFVFYMRVQKMQDAEDLQKDFLALPESDVNADALHLYDVNTMACLLTKEPEGFPDFPEVTAGLSLKAAATGYFYPDDPERRLGMQFLCRQVMRLYYDATQPRDYL